MKRPFEEVVPVRTNKKKVTDHQRRDFCGKLNQLVSERDIEKAWALYEEHKDKPAYVGQSQISSLVS
jgi:hypothetical protein